MRAAVMRGLAWQVLLFGLLLGLGAWAAINLIGNLGERSIRSGFGFLWQAAGFDIGESFLAFDGRATYAAALAAGLLNTLAVAAAGIALSTLLGTVIGLARLSRNPLVAPLAAAYVEAIRNVPLLLQLYLWYGVLTQLLPADPAKAQVLPGLFLTKSGLHFPVLPQGGGMVALALVAGIVAAALWRRAGQTRQRRAGTTPALWPVLALVTLPPLAVLGQVLATVPLDLPVAQRFGFQGGGMLTPELTALVLGLALYNAAFVAEILRGGIQSVARGQWEAAIAMGLGRGHVMRLVIIPQALRVVVPPLASQYLNLVKNSSLAVAIGYPDLMSIGNTIINQTGQAIEVIGLVMAVYLALSLAISAFMNWYNTRALRGTR
jgi:general L-amino acid transport system permease protein